MKRITMIFFGIVLILGCITLALSILIYAVLPNILLVYLTANPTSFSHDILYPNMTALYVLSAIKIFVGIVGMVKCGAMDKN